MIFLNIRRLGTLIFLLSFILSLTLLIAERLYGFGWDFHPDAVTYINSDHFGSLDSDYHVKSLINNSYYLVVNLFGHNIEALIFFNILLFSLTNFLLFKFLIKKFGYKIPVSLLVLFFLFIFAPYRMHLAISVLKDTIVIFLFVLSFYFIKYRYLFLLSMLFFRLLSVIYFATLLKSFKWILFFLLLSTSIVLLFYDGVIFTIASLITSDLSFREFDLIPTFVDYGVLGAFLRALFWPFLLLSGLFIFFSPSLAFLVVSINNLTSLFLYRYFSGTFFPPLYIYLLIAFIAFLVPGFTSFVRYSLPLVLIYPFLFLRKSCVKN